MGNGSVGAQPLTIKTNGAHKAEPAVGNAETTDDAAPSIRTLWDLRNYVTRYKGTLALAAVGLVGAASATLVLPVAVRRMIDFGFSSENAGLINSYFGMLLVVAALLAGASASDSTA